MANGGRIEYTIGFKTDKTGLNEVYKALAKIQNATPDSLLNKNFKTGKQLQQATADLEAAKKAAAAIGPALQNSFNTRLNVPDVQKFTQEINKTYGSLSNLFSTLNKGGAAGQEVATKLSRSLLTTRTNIQKTQTVLDKMGTTFMNTIKWTLSSSVIKRVTGALSEAVGYIEHLDSSLNDIRIVTKKSADEMDDFAVKANKAAQALGKATTDYTEASLIYYQQGLSDEEVKARAETTLKAANVTGQATKTVSEQLTSVWNGFKVNAEQTEAYVDKLAAVAAMSASNLEELSTGMSKVASAASNLGVDIDQLTAQISTIVSVTRQAPESVGTALKTIYARISDLKLGESDEDGLKLGDVSGGLQKLGINVLDAQGELRDLGTVIEEVAGKWNTWTSAQQAAVAQLMAGKRQYNNLVALFSNWDMYENAIDTSRNATGELQKQQDIYMESTEAHLQQLKTQWEDLYDSVLDADTIKGFADTMKSIVGFVTDFVDSIGGGSGVLTHFIGLFTTLFSGKIASGISEMMQRLTDNKAIDKLIEARAAASETIYAASGKNTAAQATADAYRSWAKYSKSMSAAQVEQMTAQTEIVSKTAEEVDKHHENVRAIEQEIDALKKKKIETEIGIDNAEKEFDARKQNTADKIHQLEANIGNKNVFGTTNQGRKDYSKQFTSSDLVDNWNSTDEGIKKVKEDLDNVINSAKKADSAIKKFLNQEPPKLDISGAIPQWTEKDFDKWSSQGVVAVGKVTEQIEALHNAGLINNEEFEKWSNILSSAFKKTEDGIAQLNQNNLDNLKGAFNDISAKMQEVGIEFEQFKKIMDGTFDPEEFLKAKPSLEEIEKSLEALNAAREKGIAIEEKSIELLEAERQKILEEQKIIQRQNTIRASTQLLGSLISIGNTLGTINNLFTELYSGEGSVSKILSSIGSIAMTSLMAFSNLSRAIQTFKNSSSKALSSIGQLLSSKTAGIIGGISAVVAFGISALTSYFDRVRKQAIERNQAIIEEVNQNQELINKNKELVNSYQDLVNQYKEGTIAQQDFLEQKQKIIAALDAEGQAALNTARNWRQAQKAIDDYNKRQAKTEKEEQKEKRNAALELGFDAMSEGYGVYHEDEHKFSYWKGMGEISNESLSDRDKEYIQTLIDAEFLQKNVDKNSGKITYTLAFELTADDEGFERLQQLQKIQDQFAKQISTNADNIYKNINYQFEELKKGEGYKDLEESLAAISEADLQIAISDSQVNLQEDLEGLENAQEIFIQSLIDAGYTTDQAMDEWIKILKDNGGEAQLKLQQKLLDLRSMTEGYFANFTGDKESTDRYKYIEDIYNQLIEKGFSSDQISGLGQDYWKQIMMTGEESLKDPALITRISSDIEEATKLSYEQAKEKIAETIGSTSDSVGKSISDAISGNLDTSSEDFQKLLDSLKEIKDSYPELTNEIETFSNTGLVGTEHWIQAAYDLQSALDKIEFESLIKKSEEAKEKLTTIVGDTPQEEVEIIADDEQFQEAMKEIMGANYQIDVEVHSDAERDFNQLVNAMQKADDLAGKIGEDFIVAADDIRDLNNAFPGILEGIEYLGDGTIKLNEEIVQSAMRAASEQEASSAQELTTKLQNAATELRAKAEVYDSMANIAHQAAEKQISSEEAKAQISQKVNEIETENDKIASQTEIDNAVAVADNSQVNAGISADNWTKSYEQAANASYEFANAAIQNSAAIARGRGPISKGNFGFTYQGSNGKTSSEAKAATGFQSAEEETAYWKNQEASFSNMAESARMGANDIEGMIVAAAAKAQGSLNKNTNVGKGKDSSKSGSEKEADHMDYLEREEDIYRQINTELENIESTLGRIDKVASHSWGEDYQQTLEEQNELLDQQIEKLEKKKKMQKGDLSTRRKQLEDVGVKFSDDGSVMTNAEQVLNNLYAGYNAMVAKYNTMSASDQEAYKAQMETEKNRIDAIAKKIDEYESTYSDFQGTLDELLDKHYEAIENEVNKFNNKINVELELSDARREWNDFWKDIVADVSESDFGGQIAASLKQLKELIGLGDEDGGTVGKLSTHLMEITDQVWAQIRSADRGGEDSIFGDDTKLSKETLQEFINKTMTAVRDAEKEVDNIAENYLKTLESAKDLIDAQVDGYDAIGKHIDHNVNMIKLLDPEDYSALNTQYENQYENDLKLVQTQKASKEFWQEQMEINREMRDSYEKGSKQWETYNKAYKESTQNYLDATEAFDTAMENALESAKEIADNLKEATFKQIDKGLSKNLGLDLLEEEWKLINEQADRYYDNVERYLNMEEYTDYLDDAANAIGLSAENQKRLNEFRDAELQKLNEKTKLQAYDIEESKARLEIMKAQMALEDAQRNKSNMRLRRDSQGNYNYQYVANDEAIEDAEAGVLTAKKEWYEIVKKQYKQTTDNILSESRRYYDLVKEWDDAKARGDEEAAARYLELIKNQRKVIDQLYADSAKNQQDLFSGTAQYFAEVENASILPQSEATVRTMVDQWVGGDDSFLGAVETGVTELNRIQQQYVEDTGRVFEEAGEDYAGLRDQGIDPTKDALDELIKSQGDLDENLNNITDDLGDHAAALDEAVRGYNDLRDAAVEAITQANAALETLAITAVDAKNKVNEAVTAAQSASSINFNIVTPSSSDNGGSGSGNSGGSGSNNSYANNSPYEITIADTAGGHTKHYSAFNKNDIYNAMAPYATGDYVQMWVTKDTMRADLTGSLSKDELRKRINGISFDTGGYTGSWNSNSGRLGILHQKELVLNASDTQNILSAVELLRTLPFTTLAQSIVDSSSNIAASFRTGTNINGISGNTTNNETKSMVVNADFSGVRSADEIYQALLELENYGLQNSYSVAPHANSSY